MHKTGKETYKSISKEQTGFSDMWSNNSNDTNAMKQLKLPHISYDHQVIHEL